MTAQDNQGDTLTLAGAGLSRFHANLAATELVDSTPPTYDSLMFANVEQRPYVYDNGVNGSMTYYIEVLDAQSGFWHGSLTLQGPGGQTARGTFALTYSPTQQTQFCGEDLEFPGPVTDAICTVTVTIPAGAAAGTWTVSTVSIADNAGNTATFRDLDALPVTVTADKVVTGSGFSASPNPVDDWGVSARTGVSFTVAGAVDGITAAYVDAGVNCVQAGAAAVSGDIVSVPVTVIQNTASCPVTGIAVVDGAGDVSLYGSEYGAPSPGVTITQVPDTPPVITSASVSPSSVQESTSAQTVTLTVDISDVAPVNEIVASLYDSSGNQVQQSGGFFSPVPAVGSGPQTLTIPVPAALAPGTYTVNIILTDIGGMESIYGPAQGGQPMPGGPLQLTVTSS